MSSHRLAMLALGAILASCAWSETVFFVAANGNDSNGGAKDSPFATLERARDAVREARAAGKVSGTVRIVLRGGIYYLPRPLILDPRDSDLSIEAAPGDEVTLSGGRLVSGWKPWKGSILQADLSKLDSKLGFPDLEFRQLFFDGQRQPLARTPNFDPKHPRIGGFLYNAGVVEQGSKTKLRYRAGELDPTKWAHPERALVTSYCSVNYENEIAKLVKVDPKELALEVDHGVYPFEPGDRYYVSNVLEELDAPGEWCVDPDQKVLYFWPPRSMKRAEVVVPALPSLVLLQGDPQAGQYVERVRLAGLHLSDCRQAAVKLTGAKGCVVAACDIRNVGVGVILDDETHACRVVACDITQTGDEGVRIIGSPTQHERVSDHVIDNNYIHDFGYGDINNMNAGVAMTACSNCQVTHNHIHDGPRFGVSQNGGNNDIIAFNHIHHMNLETCDCGLIYTVTSVDWGKPDEAQRSLTNRGNEIHHNLLHDAGGYGKVASGGFAFPHFSWGIYLDLYSSGYQVYDNIVYNTVLGGLMINGGVENVARNNIFATARTSLIYMEPWPKYPMSGNRFEGNVVGNMGRGATLYQLNSWQTEYCQFARNLVYSGGDAPRIPLAGVPARESWAKWQSLAQDEGSIVADPQFANAGRQDFRLKGSSPAYGLRFKPIDLSQTGNVKTSERRNWPPKDVDPPREPADYTPRPPESMQPALRTYDDYAVGDPERGAAVGEEAGLSSVRVTDETAASGKHSLKFTDAAGQKAPWDPYAAYPITIEEGLVHGGFDLRWEEGADFTYEWRDDPAKYHLGPQLRVAPDGHLSANGKPLLQVPAGKWVRFDVRCGLGKRATGKYDLTVRLPGAKPQEFKGLDCDPKMTFLNQFVIESMTNGPSVFYVDNLEIKVERK